MALPELLTPSGLPAFIADGHSFTPQTLYGDVDMGAGPARKRRLWTAAPKIVRVSWVLTAEQMARVHRWFERSLIVGTLHFAASIEGMDGEPVWYEAQWLEPFQKDPMALGRWRVSGSLILSGDGETEPPVLTGFESEVFIDFIVSGSLNVTPLFASEVVVALDPATRFRSEVLVELLPSW